MTDRPVTALRWSLSRPTIRVGAGPLAGHAPELAISLWAGLVAAWVASLLMRRFDGLATAAYDLGFFQQVVWNVAAHGTWTSSFQQGSFLGLHFSPILVIPAVVESLLGADARLLSVVHALGIGALVPATFAFVRAALRPSRWAASLAAGIAVGIPLWATTQSVIRSDFHPELAGVVLALAAGWAGLSGRPRAMWLLAFLALVTREDVAYAVAAVAVLVAARGRGRMRVHGRALLAVAVVVGIVVFAVLMPWLRDGLPSDTARYYRWLGDGAQVLTSPVRLPDRILAAVVRPEPWFVVAGMLSSVAALPLLRPRWLLLAVPPLGALLLSGHAPQAAIILQYPLILMAPLLVATALGARRALAVGAWIRRRPVVRRRWPGRSIGPAWARPAAAAAVLVPALLVGSAQGTVPPFAPHDPVFLDRPAALDTLRAIASAVPSDALLIADEGLVAPLAGRPAIRRLTASPRVPPDAFVLIDRRAWSPSRQSAQVRDRIVEWLATSGRTVVADDGRFVVWGPLPAAGASP